MPGKKERITRRTHNRSTTFPSSTYIDINTHHEPTPGCPLPPALGIGNLTLPPEGAIPTTTCLIILLQTEYRAIRRVTSSFKRRVGGETDLGHGWGGQAAGREFVSFAARSAASLGALAW